MIIFTRSLAVLIELDENRDYSSKRGKEIVCKSGGG